MKLKFQKAQSVQNQTKISNLKNQSKIKNWMRKNLIKRKSKIDWNWNWKMKKRGGESTSKDCIWDGYSICSKIEERWIGRRIQREDAAVMTNRLHGARRWDLQRLRFPNPFSFSLCVWLDFGEKVWDWDWKWKKGIRIENWISEWWRRKLWMSEEKRKESV